MDHFKCEDNQKFFMVNDPFAPNFLTMNASDFFKQIMATIDRVKLFANHQMTIVVKQRTFNRDKDLEAVKLFGYKFQYAPEMRGLGQFIRILCDEQTNDQGETVATIGMVFRLAWRSREID